MLQRFWDRKLASLAHVKFQAQMMVKYNFQAPSLKCICIFHPHANSFDLTHPWLDLVGHIVALADIFPGSLFLITWETHYVSLWQRIETPMYGIIVYQLLQFCLSGMYMQQNEMAGRSTDNQSEQENKPELRTLLVQMPSEKPTCLRTLFKTF